MIGNEVMSFSIDNSTRRDQPALKEGGEVKHDFVKCARQATCFAAFEITIHAQPPEYIVIPEAFESVVIAINVHRDLFFRPVTARCGLALFLHVEVGDVQWITA